MHHAKKNAMVCFYLQIEVIYHMQLSFSEIHRHFTWKLQKYGIKNPYQQINNQRQIQLKLIPMHF